VSRWTALIGLALLTFLVGVGRPAIQDADEAFYAEAGREMIAAHDWITPRFDAEPRINKPILFYWLVAADYKVAGVSEGGARLWSALAGVGLALATAGIARRWLGPGPDLIAGGMVATSLGLTRLARSALPDVPLACFVTVSIWAAFEVCRTDLAVPRRRVWLLVASAMAALGFLTKGPIAVALVLLVVGPAAVWERLRAPAGAPKLKIAWMDLASAVLLFVAIAAPWFVLAARANGVAFLRTFFVGENVDRFMTDRFNAPQPVWYYGPVIVGGLLPWSPMLLLLIRPLARALEKGRVSAAAARLAAWSVMPLAFFTVSTGKQPRYILPCLVPIVILMAREVWERLTNGRDSTLTFVGSLVGASLIAIGALAYRLSPILRSADPQWSAAGPVVLTVAGLAVVIAAIATRHRMRVAVWLLAAGVSAVAVEATVYWPAHPEPVERMAAAIAAEHPAAPICSCNAFARNIGFYAHVTNVVTDTEGDVRAFLTSPTPSLAIVDEVTLNRLEADLGHRFSRLLTLPYLDTARLRVGDLVRDPDPMKVRTVVLVRTQ
jgi:4-amino-4-deoxy-L-arabinose transferase-like glycosyltransferase